MVCRCLVPDPGGNAECRVLHLPRHLFQKRTACTGDSGRRGCAFPGCRGHSHTATFESDAASVDAERRSLQFVADRDLQPGTTDREHAVDCPGDTFESYG